MPNRNKRQQLQSMPPDNGWTLPYPWSHTPPWQQIPWRKRNADKGESRRENQEDEVKWVCAACKTTHRNPRKQTCRECGEARAPAVPKAVVKGQAGKQTGQEKPVSCGKQVAKFLIQRGVDLRVVDLKAACPEPKQEPKPGAPQEIGDMTTEAITSAVSALEAANTPEHVIKLFREELDKRAAAAKVTVDHGRMLEQVTTMRQQTAKRRDAIKAEVEDLRALLASREEDLAAHERDVEILEQQMSGLLVATAGTGPAVKRGSQQPQGWAGLRHALQAPEADLQSQEYCVYKAAAEAAGQATLDPLRWFLLTMLGPLDAEDACPPSKRPCVVAASPEQMEQDAL